MNELVRHALKNVWCNPRQDYQPIIKPGRVSKSGGQRRYIRPLVRSYDLPNDRDLFHVFATTGMDMGIIALAELEESAWVSAIALTHAYGIIFDAYLEDGRIIPKDDIWVMTCKHTYFIAIKDRAVNGFNLGFTDPYIRTYSNAWFEVAGIESPFITVYHKTITKLQDSLDTLDYIDSLYGKPGHTWLIVNGYYCSVDAWNGHGALIGDWVEVIHDSSVKRVVSFELDQRTTFTSTLDSAAKYLLHYPGNTNTIDFYDDVDFYVVYDDGYGCYYHRNDHRAVRMLTHKDYSVFVDKVVGYAHSHRGWDNTDKLSIVAIIRNSGTNKPLTYVHNRIHELYKLPDEYLVNAMVGLNANIPEWEAKNLEQSAYTELMRHQDTCLTTAMVAEAYGYNAVSRLLGDTPKRYIANVAGSKLATLLPMQMLESVVFEYDGEGRLVEYTNVFNSTTVPVIHETSSGYECLIGTGATVLNEVYGTSPVHLPENLEYRCYAADLSAGVIVEDSWVDITDAVGTAYTVDMTTRTLTWLLPSSKYPLIRFSDGILVYARQSSFDDGVLDFDIQSMMVFPSDGSWLYTQQVPMGCYDIFMNGYELTSGIDYYLEFPHVTIINKTHVVSTKQFQDIVVRGTGFCTSDLQENVKRDIGFIVDGMLSTNKHFNVRDDIVTRFSVDGKLTHRDALDFAETATGVTMPAELNGSIFQATEVLVPYSVGGIGLKSYQDRAVARELDSRVEAYMTNYLPDRGDGFYQINSHYPLYSPVSSAIIDALKSGSITNDMILAANTDMKILELCRPYSERWFRIDPTHPDRHTDTRFIMVHPHPYDHTIYLDPVQYRFVKRAVGMITNGKVEFSHFVQTGV